jgi:hypothetical protein
VHRLVFIPVEISRDVGSSTILWPRNWSSISSCISSTMRRKIQPWIDATAAHFEFSSVFSPSHATKIISLGDRWKSRNRGELVICPPPWPVGVDVSMLLWYDGHRHILRSSIRSDRRHCWCSRSSRHFDKRGVRSPSVSFSGELSSDFYI